MLIESNNKNDESFVNTLMKSEINSYNAFKKKKFGINPNPVKVGEKEYIIIKSQENSNDNSSEKMNEFNNFENNENFENGNFTAKFKELGNNEISIPPTKSKNVFVNNINGDNLIQTNDVRKYLNLYDNLNNLNKKNSELSRNLNCPPASRINNINNELSLRNFEKESNNIKFNITKSLKSETESSYENYNIDFIKYNLINNAFINEKNNEVFEKQKIEYENYCLITKSNQENKMLQTDFKNEDFIFKNKVLQIKDFNKGNINSIRKKRKNCEVIKTIFPKTASLDSSNNNNLDLININSNKSFEYLTLQKSNSTFSKISLSNKSFNKKSNQNNSKRKNSNYINLKENLQISKYILDPKKNKKKNGNTNFSSKIEEVRNIKSGFLNKNNSDIYKGFNEKKVEEDISNLDKKQKLNSCMTLTNVIQISDNSAIANKASSPLNSVSKHFRKNSKCNKIKNAEKNNENLIDDFNIKNNSEKDENIINLTEKGSSKEETEDNPKLRSLLNENNTKNNFNKFYKSDSLNSNCEEMDFSRQFLNSRGEKFMNSKLNCYRNINKSTNIKNTILARNVKIDSVNHKNKQLSFRNSISNKSSEKSLNFVNINANFNNSNLYNKAENNSYNLNSNDCPYSPMKINVKKTDILIDKHLLELNKLSAFNKINANFLEKLKNTFFKNTFNLGKESSKNIPKISSLNINYKSSQNLSSVNNQTFHNIPSNKMSFFNNNNNISNLKKFYSKSVQKTLRILAENELSALNATQLLTNNSKKSSKEKRGLKNNLVPNTKSKNFAAHEVQKYFLINRKTNIKLKSKNNNNIIQNENNFYKNNKVNHNNRDQISSENNKQSQNNINRKPTPKKFHEMVIRNNTEKDKIKIDCSANTSLKNPNISSNSFASQMNKRSDLLIISTNKHNFLIQNPTNLNANDNLKKKKNRKKIDSMFKLQPNFLPVSSDAFKKIFNNEENFPKFSQVSDKGIRNVFAKSVTNLYKIRKIDDKENKILNDIKNQVIGNDFDNSCKNSVNFDFFNQQLNKNKTDIIDIPNNTNPNKII